MKKLLALILALALAITFAGCKKTEKKADKKAEKKEPVKADTTVQETPKELTEEEKWLAQFDEENIVFTFGAVSDVHIDGAYMADGSMNKARKALRVLQEKSTTGKLDAVLIAGDLVNCTNSMGNVFVDDNYPGTKEENYITQSKAERENFKKVIAESLPDDTALFYALGNHDSVGLRHTQDFIDDFSANGTYDRYFKYDVNMDETAQGLRHCIIGGQHFFAIELSGSPYTQETYAWLRSEFDKIIAKDKNTNIFLSAHYSPEYSKASTPAGTEGFDELLQDYPQVIVMSGHDHDYVQKETSIMQSDKGYVALNCGSACYFLLQNTTPGLSCVNANDGYIQQHHGGLLLEIDKNGNVRVRRLNFKTETICADDWMIPALKNGKRELKYTAARAQQVEKPHFNEGATLQLEQNKYNFRLVFDAAVCEDYIYYYRVEVINNATGAETTRFGVSSRFFADKDKNDPTAIKKFSLNVTPLEPGDYTVRVIPIDTFSNEGTPLEGKITIANS